MSNCQQEKLYRIASDSLEVGISKVGACIRYIRFKTSSGARELCLSFDSVKERIASGSYCGAVIGRVANRIAGAKYRLNGKTYRLTKNDGVNTLHGGAMGFDTRVFDAVEQGGQVIMSLVSEDGDQGFGGRLTLTVTFSVECGSLNVQFSAVSDSDTIWSPTIHPYFNFGCEGSILDTSLQINADEYTPMDEQQIPTGAIEPVKGTALDFTQPKTIGQDLDLANELLASTRGFDHNYVLRCEHAATVSRVSCGVKMDLYTNLPGLHLYTGNHLRGFNGTRHYQPYEGLALEPQFFPNAVNQPNFEAPILQAGQVKQYYIRYQFDEI